MSMIVLIVYYVIFHHLNAMHISAFLPPSLRTYWRYINVALVCPKLD